ncbi:MAG: hypothetical protein Q9227_005340 [Pyrenula ochraceoflavens]
MASNMTEPYPNHNFTAAYGEHDHFGSLQCGDNPSYYPPTSHDGPHNMYYQPVHANSFPKTSAEQPPSSLSTASGPSVPSASSSTIGSPYSSHANPNTYSESWPGVTQGLGLDPAIANGEDFHGDFPTAGLDPETDFATQTKMSPDFVGESTKFLSKSNAQSAVSSNTFLSPPQLAINTAVEGSPLSNLSIDSILEKANSAVSSPRHFPTPISGRPITSSPTQLAEQKPILQKESDVFKTPTTPASAARTLSRVSPPCSEARLSRALTQPMAMPLRTRPHQQFSPGATPQMGISPSYSPFQGHFFSSNNGSLIPPSSSYPSLISGPRPPLAHPYGSYATENIYPPLSAATFPPPSPAPSPTPSGPEMIFQTYPPPQVPQYYPYPPQIPYREPSISSFKSRLSPHSPLSSADLDDESNKGRCPHPDCGRIFKDLKAHMLTHQSERPEKCPIANCEYNQKGFARKYDKNRHTLTHYKGTMVCGFCPGSGSAAEKSFNRADVFKRHLTSVHGVEQTPPNSRKRSPTTTAKKITSYCQDATGKCSTCSQTFSNAQDFYEHLDDCVLRVVQQEEPSEAINQQHLANISKDEDVKDTFERHQLTESNELEPQDDDDDDDEDDENDDPTYSNSRSGKGSFKANKTTRPSSGAIIDRRNAITKSGKPQRKGLTYSKGGVPLVGKGRKKRDHYPPSWGVSADKMKMKKRVICVNDGERRLWKDEIMLDNAYEVRVKLADGHSHVTDLDVETLKRTEALHSATAEEKGPWLPSGDEAEPLDLEELMMS